MELHSNLYYKHPNPHLTVQLDRLFTAHHGDSDQFIQLATEIDPEEGPILATEILDSVDSLEYDLHPESIRHVAGYSIAHFVHGSAGDEFMEAIIEFVKALLPETHIQAWGCGDDDPWEFWFKFEDGELIREDDEPLNDPEEDQEIKNSIYAWWHADLPSDIQEGFLNQA